MSEPSKRDEGHRREGKERLKGGMAEIMELLPRNDDVVSSLTVLIDGWFVAIPLFFQRAPYMRLTWWFHSGLSPMV